MTWLEPFYFHDLVNPAWLWLLILVPILFAAECMARAPGVISISTGETLARIRGGHKALARRLPALLRALALILLIIAIARPLKGLAAEKDRANVIDIMLCLDVSGSMKVMDFEMRGQLKDRLSVSKEAVSDFISSRKQTRSDRFGVDRIGLVLYAGYAWTQCPLTLDYGVLERELAAAHIDESEPEKQGTAIGSALGLATSRLRKSEAKTKIIILLTDGLNNRGELDPMTAAHLAEEYGIRAYTIGAGTGGRVVVPTRSLLSRSPQWAHLPIDTETLRAIADLTGGQFYRATDTESLKQAYQEIHQLETTEIELGDYYEYEEGFLPYGIAGAVLLALSIFSRWIWFDPLP